AKSKKIPGVENNNTKIVDDGETKNKTKNKVNKKVVKNNNISKFGKYQHISRFGNKYIRSSRV
ncbi:MAG TPA: hypothetical protein VIY08_00650, partial [Candidatus Nitrosocosmicus sp.]